MSLSHDGHFGAYAVLIEEPEEDMKGPAHPVGCGQEKPAV
jgi:hypothetical protein